MLKQLYNKMGRIRLLAVLLLLLASSGARAAHIFAIDLYYAWVSGNTYKVSIALYGDCSGAGYSSLATATPQINIYNGTSYVSALTLGVEGPGVEVTPVCAAAAGSTSCSNATSTVPGIRRFIYSATTTLPATATQWRFMFVGNMGSTSTAGRSNSITNILIGTAGSVIQLTDTLNNSTTPNTSAQFSTLPIPFFCINQPANYNPGSLDADGDSLYYRLAPGIDAGTGMPVSYIAPYSAAAPLGVSSGSFSFSNSNGQLSFTPNVSQKALVVYNVSEYRAGVFKGNCQREMTMAIMSPCTNSPPGGAISVPSGGTVTGGTQISTCTNSGTLGFHLNATDANGDSITMSVTGLPAGATFTIVNNGSPAPQGTFGWNTTGLAPGTYTFYITYQDNGCPLSSKQAVAYTVTVYGQPAAAISIVSAATCYAKAVLHITPSGTSGPFTVNVRSGSTVIHSFTGATGMLTDSLAAGTYTIRTYNAQGCYKDSSITLAPPIAPTPHVAVSSPICPAAATGSATLSGTGGTTPYTYAMGTGGYSGANVFGALAPGTYTLHLKDANGCIADTTINITGPPAILVHAATARPMCTGIPNSYVILGGYNSSGPYTYAAGSGSYSTDSTFPSLAAGSYIFHVKNTYGCVKDTTITLADSISIHATLSLTTLLCYGDSATAAVNGTGSPTGSYTYAANALPFTATNNFHLPAGSNTIHVKDDNSCLLDTVFTIVSPPAGIITPALQQVSCYGSNDGTVTIGMTGGTPAYLYSLSGSVFDTAHTFSSLGAGNYVVQVTDNNGCIYADTITITQPTGLTIDSVLLYSPACYGMPDGYVAIYAAGGTPPYSYAAGTGTYSPPPIIPGLAPGIYTLHVKDNNGCIKDTTVTLAASTIIIPHAIVSAPTCSTLGNGQVTLNAFGGAPGYTYAIGSGGYSATATYSPLTAGSYTFHIKDSHSCVKDTMITLADSLHISGVVSITLPLCYGGATGSISITGSGGLSPYTYALGSGSYSSSGGFIGLSSTTYSLHIKDGNGCIGDTTVFVNTPVPMGIAIAITPPSCFGYSDATVGVAATGGTPAYQYSLNHSAYTTTTTYSGLYAGHDTMQVRDNNGCIHDTAFTILAPAPLVITNLTTDNIHCYGGGDGMATITATGGTTPYTYAANTGAWQTANTLTGLSAGTILLHVKDNNNCAADSTIVLTQPAPLTISSIDTTNPTCAGNTDGAITLHIAGGTMPYQYATDNVNFSGNAHISAITQGSYSFYIKDTNGCVIDTTLTFSGYPAITIDQAMVAGPSCAGMQNGFVQITAGGGVAPLTYQIAGSSTAVDSGTFTGMTGGSYVVTVTDSKQCKKDTTLTIPQPALLTVAFDITPNGCEGTPDHGAVKTVVRGGTPPYLYIWSTAADSGTATIRGLHNGSYMLTVTDTNGCSTTDSALITYNNCCIPFIPDAFTPNGDGRNDVFSIRYKGDMEVVEFSIYDRFGNRVYYAEHSEKGWDGYYNGLHAEMGVYYYHARIICGNNNGNITELKGDVTLVR